MMMTVEPDPGGRISLSYREFLGAVERLRAAVRPSLLPARQRHRLTAPEPGASSGQPAQVAAANHKDV